MSCLSFIRLSFMGLLLVATLPANAAWLYACAIDTAPNGDALIATVTRPDGSELRVGVSETVPPDNCMRQALPFSAKEIEAIRPVDARIAAADRLIVTGNAIPSGFSISTVESAQASASAARSIMPFYINMLPKMQFKAYGVEERVQAVMEQDRLIVSCGPGQRPAGVLLMQNWAMPETQAEIQLHGSGNGSFELHAADEERTARESTVPLGVMDARMRQTWRFTPGAPRFDVRTWRSFSIACPNEAATLTLERLQLLPKKVAGDRPRATWVWNQAMWQQKADSVFVQAKRHNVKIVFLSIPVQDARVLQSAELSSFIRRATENNIQVWAVDGDPRMVLPSEQASAANRVVAYRNYNAEVAPDERIAGVQFDVEPYLLPGYDLAENDWNVRYVELVSALKQGAGPMPLEMVVPYWWGDKKDLLQSIAPHVSGIVVMDYRTREEDVLRFAMPFLHWGDEYKKTVRIALEAGPIEGETVRQYVRAERGELSFVSVGDISVALLARQPYAGYGNPVYRFASSSELDGSATTFHRNPAELMMMMPRLEAQFASWASFGGLALHELK